MKPLSIPAVLLIPLLAGAARAAAVPSGLQAPGMQKLEQIAASAQSAGAVMDGSPVRYIRFTLTQNFEPNWWGIHEIRVYAR